MALDPRKLRDMDRSELDKEEAALRRAIWDMQLQQSIGQLQDPHKVSAARRDLARVLTVKRQQELRQTAGPRAGGGAAPRRAGRGGR